MKSLRAHGPVDLEPVQGDAEEGEAPPWGSFADFVSQRGQVLWRAAWLLTGQAHSADDLLQTALAATYARFDRLNRHGHSYEAYVRRAMYTSYLRSLRRRSSGEIVTAVPDSAMADPDIALRRDVAVALAGLPRMQRAVLVLRYFEDLTEAQTATVLGISVGTVKSYASRARATLRRSIQFAHQELS